MSKPNPTIAEEIVVRGYSERFVRAFRELLGIEGGYVNDPVDRGGATKYGISLRFLVDAGAFDDDGDGFDDFDLDMDGDIDGRDISRLTVGDAMFLYRDHFWLALDCDSFPEPIGEILFDQGVNGGNHASRKLLQHAINSCLRQTGLKLITVDGRIGNQTRNAMQIILTHRKLGMVVLVEAYREAVRARYRAIVRNDPRQKRFLRGWLSRAEALG